MSNLSSTDPEKKIYTHMDMEILDIKRSMKDIVDKLDNFSKDFAKSNNNTESLQKEVYKINEFINDIQRERINDIEEKREIKIKINQHEEYIIQLKKETELVKDDKKQLLERVYKHDTLLTGYSAVIGLLRWFIPLTNIVQIIATGLFYYLSTRR